MYAMVRLIKDRRAAGESTKITIKKKTQAHRKELRSPEEMYELQSVIQRVLGNSFTTQVIGWCAGANSDYEIHRALREEAQKLGRVYEVPKDILETL
jgi:DNA-binding PucR family transcriptional regulator